MSGLSQEPLGITVDKNASLEDKAVVWAMTLLGFLWKQSASLVTLFSTGSRISQTSAALFARRNLSSLLLGTQRALRNYMTCLRSFQQGSRKPKPSQTGQLVTGIKHSGLA